MRISGNLQRDFHHLGKGILPLLAVQALAGKGIIRDGQQRQRVLARAGGVQIQRVAFHLHRQHAKLLQLAQRSRCV